MKVILIRCIPYAVCAVLSLTVIIRTVISVKRIRTERETDGFSSRTEPFVPIKTGLAYRMNSKPSVFLKKEMGALTVQQKKLLKSILEQKQIKLCDRRKMGIHKSHTGQSNVYPDEKIQ